MEKFEIEKREYGFVSFNDLLLRTIEDLKISDIGFDEILVDEYQDTNTLQGALIDAMKPRSLFCVGDYDQSIYAFNGANIENISTFTQRYKDANLFSLVVNYRSTASILALATRVIEHNPRIYPKKLIVGRKGEDNAPKLLVYHELFEQYHAISHAIKTSHVPYDEIAVIFRNNSSADGIEATLREIGIPCKRKGGTSFFDAKEVKFLLDLLSLKSNPKDMMAFLHIFEYARGIGSALAKEFFLALIHCGEGDFMKGVLKPSVFSLPKTSYMQQSGLFQEEWIEEKKADSKSNHSHPLHGHQKISSENMKFFDDFCVYLHAVKYEKKSCKNVITTYKIPYLS